MYKILIADDESVERRTIAQVLAAQFAEDVTILEAKNGREALELALAEKPRVAILDIDMPGMTGMEVARRIRQEQIHCVILFLTDRDSFDHANQAISLHALDYLIKPCGQQELVMSVETAMLVADQLERSRLYQHYFRLDRPARAEEPKNRTDNERLGSVRERIEEYIAENYASDLSLQSISQTLNYSEAYFCKLFKQCFQVNFSAYLNEYRIARAKELLVTTDIGVKDVSQACGYADSSYFARVFKRQTGQTPSDYRLNALKQE